MLYENFIQFTKPLLLLSLKSSPTLKMVIRDSFFQESLMGLSQNLKKCGNFLVQGQCTFGKRFTDEQVIDMANFVLQKADGGW